MEEIWATGCASPAVAEYGSGSVSEDPQDGLLLINL